jgi:hypothetical protein
MTGTLSAIATHLARAMAPLEDAFADPTEFRSLLFTLGWDAQGLPPSYLDVANKAVAAGQALAAMPDDPSAEQVLGLITKAADVYRALSTLSGAPDGVDPAEFAAEIGRRLFEYLLVEDLRREAPRWYHTLRQLGVISYQVVKETPTRPGYTRVRFDWDQIPAILRDPGLIPQRLWGWGTPDFDFEAVAGLLWNLTSSLGVATTVDRLAEADAAALQSGATAPPAREARRALTLTFFDAVVGDQMLDVGVMLAELPAEGTSLPGMILAMVVPSGLAEKIDLGGGWTFQLRAGTDLGQQLGIALREPDGAFVRYPGAPGQALPSAGFGLSLAYLPQRESSPSAHPPPDGPTVLFGQTGHSRLELAGGGVGVDIDLKAGDLEVKFSATTSGLAFVLNPTDFDGFLGSMLGLSASSKEARVLLPLGLTWSSRTGLDFMAGAGIATSLYPHLAIGPVRVDRLDLEVKLVTDPAPELDIRTAVALSGSLGPVSFSVDRLGAQLAAQFHDGNAGPFDLALRPLWPTGLGLAVDAGPIGGGGFISYDPDHGRYVGMLSLHVFEVAVTAIGILDTRDATGAALPSPGYSLLIVISAELPPIQLGFGFTLNGVGGIAALNRRLDATALLGVLRTSGLDKLFFDPEPVRDAPTIVANLGTVFPVAMGRYVFGPLAIIGWGTPTLIRIELAVVVEVPAPVVLALIGQASVVLPDQNAPIVSLHVDVVGVYDSGKRSLAVDASLRDSHVAAFSLAGDLALRADFSDKGAFALAVGGFNPHFTAPAGFPAMRRVSVALGLDDNPRVTLEGYLAVTSNSRQFGAKAELYAAAGGFNVHGFLGFDALLTLHPFAFEVDFAVGMSLNHGTSRIAGVTVKGVLTGPNPFRADGEASLSLLFFDIMVPFHATFGDLVALPDLAPADPWPLLHDAIALVDNWTTAAVPTSVSLARTADAPLLPPTGAVSLRQRVVPLGRVLERFGQYDIAGPHRFDVTAVAFGGSGVTYTPVTDHFAPGDFENLSPSDQISRDSFEEMTAGVRVAAAATLPPPDSAKLAPVEYETKIIDTSWRSRTLPRATFDRTAQLSLALRPTAGRGGAFVRAVPRPTAVGLDPELYTVASDDTLAARADVAAGVTKGAAVVALRAAGLAGLQVVPDHEVAP